MRFLVTGANGFVGSAMCAELAARGYEVCAAARTMPRAHDAFTNGVIDAGTDWAGALEGVSVVVHLAARVHVMRDTAADPIAEFIQTNVEGTLNLARQAARAGVNRFVYVSSVKVHGESTAPDSPFTELCEPQPQDPYAISKWQAEQALLDFGREAGLEVVVVRPPLVYGPEVRANFLQLLRLVSRGYPLPFKAIANKRSLIYVGNLVDSLILCSTHRAAAGETYLVDDGLALSSGELVAVMAESLGVASRDLRVPVALMRAVAGVLGRSAAVERLTQSLVVDSRKIRTQLGWVAPFDVVQGLHQTARWFTGKSG